MAQNRYTKYSTKTSEEFNTASRSVKPGLIACGVVSAWTWAATLLQSSTVAYEYGISGPFWVNLGFELHVSNANSSAVWVVLDIFLITFILIDKLRCRWCYRTDLHVQRISCQGQAECPNVPHIP